MHISAALSLWNVREWGIDSCTGQNRQTDFPLHIFVQSDKVGTIIGRQGSTIRQITQQARARVDIHRKNNVGSHVNKS